MTDAYEVEPVNPKIPQDPPDVTFGWIARNFGKALPVLLNPPKLVKLTSDDIWGPHAHLALLLEAVFVVGIVVGIFLLVG